MKVQQVYKMELDKIIKLIDHIDIESELLSITSKLVDLSNLAYVTYQDKDNALIFMKSTTAIFAFRTNKEIKKYLNDIKGEIK